MSVRRWESSSCASHGSNKTIYLTLERSAFVQANSIVVHKSQHLKHQMSSVVPAKTSLSLVGHLRLRLEEILKFYKFFHQKGKVLWVSGSTDLFLCLTHIQRCQRPKKTFDLCLFFFFFCRILNIYNWKYFFSVFNCHNNVACSFQAMMQAPGGLGRTRAEQWVHMALRRGTAGCVKMGMAFCYLLNHIDRKTNREGQTEMERREFKAKKGDVW